MSVKTNIARKFISLVKRHFNKDHPLRSLFNKNNMRVSYSCTRNLGAIIKSHNSEILNQEKEKEVEKCNCRKKSECPLAKQGVSCRTSCAIYKAEITTKTERKYYIGLCETAFKTRYYNHKTSFNNRGKANQTELSKLVWKLKDKNEEFELEWSILKTTKPLKDGDSTCRLCLLESNEILHADKNCINKRTEILGTCRHKRKFFKKFLINFFLLFDYFSDVPYATSR